MNKSNKKINKSFRTKKIKIINFERIHKTFNKLISNINKSETYRELNINFKKKIKENIQKKFIKKIKIIEENHIFINEVCNYNFLVNKNIVLNCTNLWNFMPLNFKLRTNNIYNYKVYFKGYDYKDLNNEFNIDKQFLKENDTKEIIIIINSLCNRLELVLNIKSNFRKKLFKSKAEFDKLLELKTNRNKSNNSKKKNYLNFKTLKNDKNINKKILDYKIKKKQWLLEDINRKKNFNNRKEINKIKREEDVNNIILDFNKVISIKNFWILLNLVKFLKVSKNQWFSLKIKLFDKKIKNKKISFIQNIFKLFYVKNKGDPAKYKSKLYYNTLITFKNLNSKKYYTTVGGVIKEIYHKIKLNEDLKFYRAKAIIIKNRLKHFIYIKKIECHNFYQKINRIVFNIYQYSINKNNKFSHIFTETNSNSLLNKIQKDYLKKLINIIYEYFWRLYIMDKYKLIEDSNSNFNYENFIEFFLKNNFKNEYILIKETKLGKLNKLLYLDILNYNISNKNKLKKLKSNSIFNSRNKVKKIQLYKSKYNIPNQLKLKLIRYLNYDKKFLIKNYFNLENQYLLIFKILKIF